MFQLASSFYTESFEALLGISNEKLYLDEYQSQIFWCPRVVYENIEEDMAAAEKSIRRKFVRIEDFELMHIKRKTCPMIGALYRQYFVFYQNRQSIA